MTAALSGDRASSRVLYTIQRITDRDEIRAWLQDDRVYAAYALAQLDERLFPASDWYAAEGPDGRALVMHSRSGLGRAFFATGDPLALDALLSLHPGPRFSFGSLKPEHRRVAEKFFFFTRPQTMLRMSVAHESFRPSAGATTRLSGADLSAINRLYSAEGAPSNYRPQHIDDAVYYGVVRDGLLVSIAGTHVISDAERIGVVGNVFTHPAYRGRGFGAAATSATTAELLRRDALVVLTVEAENGPAISVYRRLGYDVACTLHETPLLRKEPFGTFSLVRRALARWRGQGTEVVAR